MFQSLEQFGLITVGALTVFYFFVRYSQSYWKKRGILHEKPKFLWGNLKGAGKSRHIAIIIREIYKKYKDEAPFIGFYAYLRPMVLILNMDLVRYVLVRDASHFRNRGLYSNMQNDMLCFNMLQADGGEYERIRQASHSVFAPDGINSIFPTLHQLAVRFESSLRRLIEQKPVININHIMESYCLDTISQQAFAFKSESLVTQKTPFYIFVKDYFEKYNRLKTFFIWNYPELASFLSVKYYNESTIEYFGNVVNSKLKDREFQSEPRNTVLKKFAELKRAHILDNKTITAQLFLFLSHGLELLYSTLTFCLYELAIHQDIQDKTRKEITDYIEKNGNITNVYQIDKIVYLKQILYETLRKYTPYPVLLRTTNCDYEVPDSVFMLQKSNSLIIPIDAIHHDETYFPDPEKFDPSRFDPDEIRKRKTELCWMPFGAGNRSCYARQFATVHIQLFLITILQKYKFSPTTETPIPLQIDNRKVPLTPKGNIPLRIESI